MIPTARRQSKQITIGDDRVGIVKIGGDAPVMVQSMTCTDTADAKDTVRQIKASDTELRYLLRNALMLVYPSLYEGFGLTAVEAMVQRCPALTAQLLEPATGGCRNCSRPLVALPPPAESGLLPVIGSGASV